MTAPKTDTCAVVREAGNDKVDITRHAKLAEMGVRFVDWSDCRLENDEHFL